MNAHAPTPWSDAEIEFAKLRHAAGDSAGEVARQMKGRSRNAVIGVWHRLKLSKPAVVRVAKPARSTPAPKPFAAVNIARRALADDPGLPEESSDGQGITLDALTNRTCRWPKGTPGEEDFRYCGVLQADNPARPYCGHHMQMAYEAPKPRKVQR